MPTPYPSFSIRSFGSWGEAIRRLLVDFGNNGFSIRSFGSWGEAVLTRWLPYKIHSFSIRSFGSWGEAQQRGHSATSTARVSVSALSDRGVRHVAMIDARMSVVSFSIRSFGSWGEASWEKEEDQIRIVRFQYPLFRIVG